MKRRRKNGVRRYVDMWLMPNLHPTNIDLLQRLKTADDRQFGTNMDVCGTVSDFDGEAGRWSKTHLVGIRSDIWSPNTKEMQRSLNALKKQRQAQLRREIKRSGRLTPEQQQRLVESIEADTVMSMSTTDICRRRLVLKLFRTTASRIRWCGTIEELTTREIHNSIGSRRTILSLTVMVPGYEYLTEILQNHRTFRIPALYTFCFFDALERRMWYVTIKRKWISIGADFVIESEGRKIGDIDGQLIGLGYNAYITLDEPRLARHPNFMDLLTLFATSVGYHRSMRRSIRRRVTAAQQGPVEGHLVEDEEFWLLKNPRRRAA